MTATIRRVARPRQEMTPTQYRKWVRANSKADDAREDLQRVTLEILAEGVSFAELSKRTGLSTNTLQRWKREAQS